MFKIRDKERLAAAKEHLEDEGYGSGSEEVKEEEKAGEAFIL
jgi:hypothetical protein